MLKPGTVEIDFQTDLTMELLKNAPRRGFDNTDRLRFPATRSHLSVKARIAKLAASRGLYRFEAIPKEKLYEVLGVEGLSDAYALLDDKASKHLLMNLLAFRILGPRHVVLPLNNEKFWEQRESLGKYVETANAVRDIPVVGSLDLLNFNGIRFVAHRLNIEGTFLLEQYRYVPAGIGVESDDVVIDAGGCWGDTALYFAQKAERVFCFECMPSNLRILQENLSLNPALAAKISVVPKALWERSGETLGFEERGPGSLPSSTGTTVQVQTQTIDDFVRENSLQKIDLIKMDIEGSEPHALRGAEETIRTHRPKLAIAIYHDLRHFASIPNWIESLGLGYKLYIGHFTIHAEETVLFAALNPKPGVVKESHAS
jgi:FkbM family methyltransferase